MLRSAMVRRHPIVPSLETLEGRRMLAGGGNGNSGSGNLAGGGKTGEGAQKPGKPDLQASSDNGVSNIDNITSVVKPVFDVDKVDAGMTVQLLRDGVVVAGMVSASGGMVSMQDPGNVPVGAHDY